MSLLPRLRSIFRNSRFDCERDGEQRFHVEEQTRRNLADVMRMVLQRGMALAILGTLAGLLGAAALLRVLASLVPGLPGQDALGIFSVIALLLGVALVATLLPARRATKVDPMIALRAE